MTDDQDNMITHLKRAVELGYQLSSPGYHKEVREAFPDLFASSDEVDAINWTDELEHDDHPIISRGDNGYWVSCWTWISVESDEEDEE